MPPAIRIENVSELNRLGTVGTGTISHDINRWWHTVRRKEDPHAEVGQTYDRTQSSTKHQELRFSTQQPRTANEELPTKNAPASSHPTRLSFPVVHESASLIARSTSQPPALV